MSSSVKHAPLAWPEGCQHTPLAAFLTLVVGMVNRCLEEEHRRQAARTAQLTTPFHFVVVGGGSSGCVVAERLSRDPDTTVLLLERGGTEPEQTRVPGFMTYVYRPNTVEVIKTTPEPQSCNGTGCVLVVPHLLGGGSSVNGMMYVRGNPADFDAWADETGDPGWSFDNVLPYFKRAERNLDPAIARDTKYHSTTGPQRVSWQPYRHPMMRSLALALEDTGVPFREDINADGQLGHSVIQSTSADGERWSTFRSYLQPALGRPNLRVVTWARVTRVLFDEGAPPRAVGVEYRDAAGKIRVAAATKEVVLAAGSLHTPQVLMLSGVGDAEELAALNISSVAHLPGVGKNLQDHPLITGLEYACSPPLSCEVDWPHHRADLAPYRLARRGPLSTAGTSELTAFLRTNATAAWPDGPPEQQPDLQIMFMGAADIDGRRCTERDAWRYNALQVMPAVLHPRSRGSVRLNASDPLGQPVVTMSYFTDPEGHDLAVAVRGLQLGRRLERPLRGRGLRLVRDPASASACRDLDHDAVDYLECVVRTTSTTVWHWVSTCRMGREDDEQAVVNASLLVRKVQGLRVVDASVMPTLTSGNTNAPTIMIAERAADLIRRHHGLPIL